MSDKCSTLAQRWLTHERYDMPTPAMRRLMHLTCDSLDLTGLINETYNIPGPKGRIHETFDTSITNK